MAKKPPSAYTKKAAVQKQTSRNWVMISIYVVLALALLVPLVASVFGYTGYPGGHGGY